MKKTTEPSGAKKPFTFAYHLGSGPVKVDEVKEFINQAINEVGDLQNLSIKAKIADVKNGNLGKILIVM